MKQLLEVSVLYVSNDNTFVIYKNVLEKVFELAFEHGYTHKHQDRIINPKMLIKCLEDALTNISDTPLMPKVTVRLFGQDENSLQRTKDHYSSEQALEKFGLTAPVTFKIGDKYELEEGEEPPQVFIFTGFTNNSIPNKYYFSATGGKELLLDIIEFLKKSVKNKKKVFVK